ETKSQTSTLHNEANYKRNCDDPGIDRVHGSHAHFKAPLLNYGTPLPLQPKIKKIMHITRNRKNSTLAIPADAAAMPPNPNTAATIAIIRKVIAQPNIISPP